MASDHTADPSAFNDPIEMMTGADRPTAQAIRAPLEKLADNCAFLRQESDALGLRQVLTLRKKTAVLSDTGSTCAASALYGAEAVQGPAVFIKGQESLLVYDNDDTEDFGAVPDIGATRDAATDPDGLIVVIGSSTPFNAFRAPGGSWTGGGSEIGGSPNNVIYDPGYGGFMASRTTNVWRSTDAASWASSATGLAGVQRVAAIGAGPGAGRIVALSTATAPVFAVSIDHGATFSASGGTVPHAASADGAGLLVGCPLVSRLGLNEYVYHVARYDSGARLRLARSQDGENWEAGPTIEAEDGYVFSGTPILLICQSTGLMVINAPASHTAESRSDRMLYTSRNFTRWTGVASHAGTAAALAYAVARGRVMFSNSADLTASDGIGFKVFTV